MYELSLLAGRHEFLPIRKDEKIEHANVPPVCGLAVLEEWQWIVFAEHSRHARVESPKGWLSGRNSVE